jgi:protein-arginine kinase activator protein McsA
MPKEAVATIDVSWKIRVACHNCGKGYRPKPGEELGTCPNCYKLGHRGNETHCRACQNVRHYTR